MKTIKILFIISLIALVSGAIMFSLYLLDILNNTKFNTDIITSLFAISMITSGLSAIFYYYNSILDKLNS